LVKAKLCDSVVKLAKKHWPQQIGLGHPFNNLLLRTKSLALALNHLSPFAMTIMAYPSWMTTLVTTLKIDRHLSLAQTLGKSNYLP
jgi:hypothetical protein